MHDVEKYRADPDAFMKEEIIETKEPKAKSKKTTFELIDNAATGDDDGFETVGRDGKTLAYTPESILKSMLN